MLAAPRKSLGCWLVLSIALSATLASAQIDGLTWEPAETVDGSVLRVSGSSAPSAAHTPMWHPWNLYDEWHVVYAKDGEIYHAVRTNSGWQTPERLTSDPADSRDPKIAFGGGLLHVVWEDDRTGHPEIWTRRWDLTSWSAEECLTGDAVDSRAASIAGRVDEAVLAWQEGPDASAAVIERTWDGFWGPRTVVAQPAGFAAREPSVTMHEWGSTHRVYWSDTRFGLTEIMGRRVLWNGAMDPEIRVTDMAGSCGRPSAHTLICCGDMLMDQVAIAFENNASGIVESFVAAQDEFGVTPPQQISPAGGVPSERPSMHGFQFSSNFGMGGTFPQYLMTWTEATTPGTRDHILGFMQFPGYLDGTETYADAGRDYAVVATSQEVGRSDVLCLTIETVGGTSSLVAHRGSMPNCYDPLFDFDPVIVAPEGIPETLVLVRDRCAGGTGYVEGAPLELSFDAVADAAVTWDETQQHPTIPVQETDENGVARFGIRGGGCSAAGRVSLRAYGVEVLVNIGVHSPDVNGDCAVLEDDLAYVQARLGTADPCADVDGSGIVNAADVAIVQATLGDLCSQLVDVGDPETRIDGFRIVPNPCRERALFVTGAPGQGEVAIADAAGRIVRRLGRGAAAWDLNDESGRRVAPGVYFAVRSSVPEAATQRRMIAVLPR